MHVIQKTIGELITPGDLPIVSAQDTVDVATATIQRCKSAAVLVCEGDRLVGIFTERDLLNRVAAVGRKPSETAMADVMTSDPRTLRREDCVTYAVNQMAVFGFTNIPIVDNIGRPVALLGVREVMAHLSALFAVLEDKGSETSEFEIDGWVDIGGG